MRIKSEQDLSSLYWKTNLFAFFWLLLLLSCIIPFLLDEKSTWESPQPQNFCCQKEFFLSFGAPIAKKKGVCVVVKPASFRRNEKEDAPKQTSAFCLEKERRTCNNRETTGSFKVLECVHD